MASSDLASLQDVKDWLQVGPTTFTSADDALLGRLVTTVSGMIYGYLSRQAIVPRTVTERYDGVGAGRVLLRNWPVLSVQSVVADGVTLGAGTYPSASTSVGWPPSGYVFSPWDGSVPGKPQVLDAFANPATTTVTGPVAPPFSRGRQNVQVTYLCGYSVQAEAASVPPSPPYAASVLASYGPWASDMGVAYAATGAKLTAVASAPVAGQYVAPVQGVPSAGQPAQYVFSAADAGAAVLVTYGFVPSALNDACVEWAAERYRYRGRVGQKSQTVAGQQTAAYDTSQVPAYLKAMLDPYRNVVPSAAWY